MRALVIGGTGQVGSRLVAWLRARGVTAVAAARHAGTDGITVDLTRPETVEAAARGCDVAYLQTPIGPDEARIGLAAVAALERVPRLVFMAIHNLEAMADIPHFAAKAPVQAAVLARPGGAVIAPNFFQENDLIAADAIRYGGVYPLPLGVGGVWSVAVDDVAAAAGALMLEPDRAGHAWPVCGPEVLTGPGLAASWSAALARPIAYGGDATAPFLAMMRGGGADAWLLDDMERMMRVTQARGCPASAADLADARALLGREPRAHAAFAVACAQDWARAAGLAPASAGAR